MSNYHVEPADKPQALTPRRSSRSASDQVQGISRRELLRRSIGGGVALWLTRGHRRHDRLPVAEPARAASAARSRSARSTTSSSRTQRCRSPTASRPTSRTRGPTSSSSTPSRQQFVAGDGHDRRRHRAQRPRRSTSAARTSAASRTRASRTSGSSARATARATTGSGSRPLGAAVRPGAAEHGPLLGDASTATASLTLDTGKITLGPLPSRSASRASSRREAPTGCI